MSQKATSYPAVKNKLNLSISDISKLKEGKVENVSSKVCFPIRKDLYEMIKTVAKTDKVTIQEKIEDLLKIGYSRIMEVKGIEKYER